jgi:RimJ/RimL family protein N-acetyltransferase
VPPPPTARLSFRDWQESDAPVILDLYSRPEVYRFLGSAPAPVADLDEARARIRRWAERAGEPWSGIWAVVVEGRPIGTGLLASLPRSDGTPSDAVEIGWHLHPDAWGRGYATEMGHALLAYARAHGLEPVRAVVYPDNTASRAVCRRLGMTEVGITDRWYGVTLVEYATERASVVDLLQAGGEQHEE